MKIPQIRQKLRGSITVKVLSIGILILLLLIPTSMIESIIHERENTSEEAVREVSAKWGDQQTLAGPMLVVPYEEFVADPNSRSSSSAGAINNFKRITNYAYFLPEELKIVGTVSPETRYRGIYEVVVYNSSLHFESHFNQPDFSGWNIPKENILWSKAQVVLGIPDMRGIEKNINLNWNGQTLSFNPGLENKNVISSGVNVPVGVRNADSAKAVYHCSFDLELNGSDGLYFIPLGKETNVSLSSSWPDPSFTGEFLPDTRTVTPEGFEAHWNVLHLNRSFPQQWIGDENLMETAFGVELQVPVEAYHKSMRTIKYSIMFICLTFLTFFFIEILTKARIHPLQYLLIGLALSLFYLLLLSMSEHIGFNLAYLIAAVAMIALITGYSHTIFGVPLLTRLTGLILLILYGFIYTLLQLQDYALLIGSIGLFIVLALVMYMSRKIDWYGFGKPEEENSDTGTTA